jgi:hypothetical protein
MGMNRYVYQEHKAVITDIFDTTDIVTSFLLSDLCPPREHEVVYNHFAVNKIIQDVSGSGAFIFYNTEQLTRPEVLTAVVNTIKSAGDRLVETWDYSQVNVDILAKEGITARLVPVKVCEFYSNWLNERRAALPRTYDVGFCGILNKRRLDILTELKRRGKSVRAIHNMYSRARDSELLKCKMFVNIHFTEDYKVWESVRCEPLLHVGAPVVSENSLDNDPRCVNVPYEGLVDAVCAELDKLDAAEEAAKAAEETAKAAEENTVEENKEETPAE